MRWVFAFLAALLAGPVQADGERAGDFDYYVLSLSWSASWCALEGDARDDPQCDRGRGLTFVLHGLWPQYEDGWPQYCRTGERDPTRSETAAMADVMGGAGPAFYQWKKHGRCSGLPPAEYFATARRAFGTVAIPPVFRQMSKRLKVPASVIEGAFLEANPPMRRRHHPRLQAGGCGAGGGAVGGCRPYSLLLDLQDDLANMARGFDPPMRLRGLVQREFAVQHHLQRAPCDHRPDMGLHLRGDPGLGLVALRP